MKNKDDREVVLHLKNNTIDYIYEGKSFISKEEYDEVCEKAENLLETIKEIIQVKTFYKNIFEHKMNTANFDFNKMYRKCWNLAKDALCKYYKLSFNELRSRNIIK